MKVRERKREVSACKSARERERRELAERERERGERVVVEKKRWSTLLIKCGDKSKTIRC